LKHYNVMLHVYQHVQTCSKRCTSNDHLF
jgi:hypothetical protein